MSKKYTSPAVKNRWNAAHYDRITVMCYKGGRSLVKELAKAKGLSVSAYIISLICADAHETGRDDVSTHLRGGG